MPPNMQALWERLTPAHQTLVTQLIESLATLDTLPPPARPPDKLSALFAEWAAEDAALTPDEVAAAEAEWHDIRAALNRNRTPEPPLFP